MRIPLLAAQWTSLGGMPFASTFTELLRDLVLKVSSQSVVEPRRPSSLAASDALLTLATRT
jgi:hypothetical protein